MAIKDTMEEAIAAISTVKSFAKYLIIPLAIIVFMPDSWLAYLHLLEIKNAYGTWLSSLFWISVSILFVDFIIFLWKKMKSRQMLKGRFKVFDTLNETEWDILYLIYSHDAFTFEATDVSVSCLTKQNIILN